jgi:hypothetical protein
MAREGGPSSNRWHYFLFSEFGDYWMLRLREGFAKVAFDDSFSERFAGGGDG